MTEETRNLIIATISTVFIFVGWHYYYEAPKQEKLKTVIEKEENNRFSIEKNITDNKKNIFNLDTFNIDDNINSPVDSLLSRDDLLQGDSRVRFTTSFVNGSLRLRGAFFDDLVLTRYRDTLDEDSSNVVLLSPYNSEKPYFFHFGWVSSNKSLSLPGINSIWSNISLDNDSINIKWENKNGLTFYRSIKDIGEYLFQITQEVLNESDNTIRLYPYSLILRYDPLINDDLMSYQGPLGYFNDKLHEESYNDLQEKKLVSYKTSGGWFGITDKYWFTAIIPNQNVKTTVSFKHSYDSTKELNNYQIDTVGEYQSLDPGERLKITTHIFVGAKVISLLDKYEQELELSNFDRATDFGWFHFLAKPAFYVLKFFNELLGNFGLALLLLTVIVKVLFFPIANKSYRSMAALKVLAPEIEKIKGKFSDDKLKMQQEIMELYKRHKVNPASGCLPMLLQLPIFFSIYKVLMVSIEMRQAPFYGWISDLSVPDPLNIFTLFGLFDWSHPSFLNVGLWPLLMGVTMLVQQRLNPPPSDPIQEKVFLLMPLVFVFIFARFPAGLVIYWTWSNVLSVIQQWFIMRNNKK
jgi:YidC/Oxa1 family membrane protein insertase